MEKLYSYIIIKQIGDLKEPISVHDDYSKAKEIAQTMQDDIHSRGYTDFKVYADGIDFFKHKS